MRHAEILEQLRGKKIVIKKEVPLHGEQAFMRPRELYERGRELTINYAFIHGERLRPRIWYDVVEFPDLYIPAERCTIKTKQK